MPGLYPGVCGRQGRILGLKMSVVFTTIARVWPLTHFMVPNCRYPSFWGSASREAERVQILEGRVFFRSGIFHKP